MFFVDFNGESQKILYLTLQVLSKYTCFIWGENGKVSFLDVEASHDKCKRTTTAYRKPSFSG